MKLGRRPPLVSPYSVNCDTESTAPPTSRIDRLSLPCSSSKIRRCAILSASVFASASVSSVDTPSSTAYPCPIWAISSPSTFTPARTTRCTTARIPVLRHGSLRQFKPGLPDSPCDEVTDELSGHGSQRDSLPFVPGRHKKSVRPGPSDDRPAQGGHRDLDADQAADGGRPHPTGAHHSARGDSFRGNHDVRDAPVFYTDRCNRTPGEHFHAAGAGGRDDRLTYLRRLRGGLIGAMRAAGKISGEFRLQIYERSTIQQLNCCPARGRGLDLVPQPVELRGRRGKHHPAGAVHDHAGLRRQSIVQPAALQRQRHFRGRLLVVNNDPPAAGCCGTGCYLAALGKDDPVAIRR